MLDTTLIAILLSHRRSPPILAGYPTKLRGSGENALVVHLLEETFAGGKKDVMTNLSEPGCVVEACLRTMTGDITLQDISSESANGQ